LVEILESAEPARQYAIARRESLSESVTTALCTYGVDGAIIEALHNITITVAFPIYQDGDNADQLARLDTEFERVFSYAAEDAIGELMSATNTITTDVSIIGVESRSSRRSFEENRAVRELTLRAYCADVAIY
jgi:hypothetical protein